VLSEIADKLNALDMRVTAGELPDHVPRGIPATVFDEDDFKIRADAFKHSRQSTMKFAQGPFGPVYGDNYRNLRHHFPAVIGRDTIRRAVDSASAALTATSLLGSGKVARAAD